MRLPVAGMRGRLLSLVLLNVLALAVVGGVVYASFDRVQELARRGHPRDALSNAGGVVGPRFDVDGREGVSDGGGDDALVRD